MGQETIEVELPAHQEGDILICKVPVEQARGLSTPHGWQRFDDEEDGQTEFVRLID